MSHRLSVGKTSNRKIPVSGVFHPVKAKFVDPSRYVFYVDNVVRVGFASLSASNRKMAPSLSRRLNDRSTEQPRTEASDSTTDRCVNMRA